MAHYTYKFRLYPTDEQKQTMAKHFGCQRFIYNHFLNKRQQRYLANESSSYNKDAGDLTHLKNEYEWLREPNSQSLQRTLRNLDTAFNRFFAKKAKFPKFKSRKSKQSFCIPQNTKVENKKLYIPKFKEGIAIRQHREFEGTIINSTISKRPCGHYYVCIVAERNIGKLESNGKSVGIDLGVKYLATCSNGKRFKNIKPYRTLERKLAQLQRSHSRKVKGSNNRDKARLKLARLYERISNIRSNHLHQITHQIVSENQTIILEDLCIRGMLKNRRLAKSVADVSLYEFVRQITYKAEWAGRTVVFVDRWYPSSKTCFHCGFVNQNLTLNDREWECPSCGRVLDRDFNASQNIEREGKRTVGTTELACREDIRLSVRKRSSVMQEAPIPLGSG
jgi:putative transposase